MLTGPTTGIYCPACLPPLPDVAPPEPPEGGAVRLYHATSEHAGDLILREGFNTRYVWFTPVLFRGFRKPGTMRVVGVDVPVNMASTYKRKAWFHRDLWHYCLPAHLVNALTIEDEGTRLTGGGRRGQRVKRPPRRTEATR